jgi:hypothetical protein
MRNRTPVLDFNPTPIDGRLECDTFDSVTRTADNLGVIVMEKRSLDLCMNRALGGRDFLSRLFRSDHAATGRGRAVLSVNTKEQPPSYG